MLPRPDITVRIPGTEILNDKRREALEELVEVCREEGFDGEIAYRPPTGRGISIWEVTAIYLAGKLLDAATGQLMKTAVEKVTKRATAWAKDRLRRGDSSRPQKIKIYAPTVTSSRKSQSSQKTSIPAQPVGFRKSSTRLDKTIISKTKKDHRNAAPVGVSDESGAQTVCTVRGRV